MQSSFYVGMSGQIAIDKRLQSVATNIANMNTAGYRADGVTFATVLSNTGDAPVAFSSGGADYISRRTGEMTKTDNPLDVAVQGDAWFGIKTPSGIAYTRDGRMKMAPDRRDPHPQRLSGARRRRLGAAARSRRGPPTIAADGMITQGGRQVGAIGLFSIDPHAKLTRTSNSGVIPDQAATPVLDFTSNGVVQGFVEGSNINPVLELSKLIEIQHALDGMTQMNQTAEASLGDAIKTLGGTS